MTGASGDPGSVPQPSSSARFLGHPVNTLATWSLGTGAAAVTIVASVIGVLGGGETPSPTSSSPAAPASASVAPPSETEGAGPSGRAVGACLTDAGVPVACERSHASEVFSVGQECLMTDLVAYLGVEEGVDVVRPDLVVSSLATGGDPVCAVTVPVGAGEVSNADALRSETGSAWRWCQDDIGRTVSCSEPHTSEVISDGGAASCQDRADEYLGSSFEARGSDLVLATDGDRCLVQVRGTGALDDSVRRLGARALPLEAVS